MAPRTKFGETWWGNEWLKSLAKIDHANRLPRGRTYFNTGHVESLEWHAEDHEIYATVSGSAYFPYEITIGIPPAKEANVEKLVEATAERPDLCAELLAGRLPAELNDLALAAGVELFPTSWRSFRMRCSCPDSAVPCKHLAAVIYAVSKHIDEDPFWVFTFRGINLVERLKAYGVRLDETSSVSIPKWEDYAARVRAEKPEAVPEEEEALALLQNLPFAALPKMGELLSSLLGDAQPYFLPKTFRADLAKLRKTLRKTASDRLAALTATDDDIRIPEAAPAKLRLGGRRRFEWTKEASADWETIYGLPFASVRRAPAPVAAWHAAHVAMLQLVAHDAYAPVLFAGGMMEDEGRSAEVFFVPAVGSPAVRTLLGTLGRGLSPFLPAMLAGKGRAKCRVTDPSEAALSIVTKLLADFLTVPALKLFQTPESAFFAGLNANEFPRAPFYDDAEPFVVQVADWLSPYFLASRAWTPVLTVRSGKEGDVTLNFGVLEEEKKDNAKALPVLLRTILKEERWEKERYGVLQTLSAASRAVPVFAEIGASRGKPAHLEKEGLRDFLFTTVPLLEFLGVRVMLPKSLQKLLTPRLAAVSSSGGTVKKESAVSLASLADYDLVVEVGGRRLTKEEFEALAKDAGKVVPFDDGFVYLDPAALDVIRRRFEEKTSRMAKIRMLLSEESEGVKIDVPEDFRARLAALCAVDEETLPATLTATLRPYQERGYSWLMKNYRLGLGSLIADDMGLGKTLQVIAALTRMKEEGEFAKKRALAVVPTSLLTNWQREIAKFSPNLTVGVYHGASRALPEDRPDVLLTTYGTARRDAEILSKERWRVLVLDEAQALKNESTQQTRALRTIKADRVIAMSGTPVENSLLDFRSILSTVEPGVLGSLKDFTEQFLIPVEVNHDLRAAEALKRLTAPFLLRRLKSDPKIAADLPEKIENDFFVSMTHEQAALYTGVVQDALARVQKTEKPEERRSLVLQLVMRLKQICNSPSQYEKRTSAEPDSAKATALLDLLARSRAAGRKVLVFTQFRETGERLQDWIERATGRRPEFLHGGVSIAARTKMVDAFQNDRRVEVLLISLKAGGTGLNLTAASTVVHYDLWWNPAVEAQATDRAYRIGQKRDVLVYRLITEGTFEEKINRMLAQKRELADLTVATGETWIGDLSNDELADLFGAGAL